MPARLAGRLLTGPAAFFVAGAIDWGALLGKVVVARARGHEVKW